MSEHIFWLLLWENLSPKTFKNRPIWSHWSRSSCNAASRNFNLATPLREVLQRTRVFVGAILSTKIWTVFTTPRFDQSLFKIYKMIYLCLTLEERGRDLLLLPTYTTISIHLPSFINSLSMETTNFCALVLRPDACERVKFSLVYGAAICSIFIKIKIIQF